MVYVLGVGEKVGVVKSDGTAPTIHTYAHLQPWEIRMRALNPLLLHRHSLLPPQRLFEQWA